MGNLWSSAKKHSHWNFSEDELCARYLYGDGKDARDTASARSAETRGTQRKAEAHCAYMIPTLLAMAQKNPALRILDVGCGSGEMSVDFSQLCPCARVVGLDLSGAVLSSARVYAEARGGAAADNVTFVQGSVYDMPEAWTGEFDVVHTHQAVAHFPERVRAIRELMRVTRAGGVVCMREGDLKSATFYPAGRYEDLEECFGVVVKVHEASGGAADAGRRLRGWTVEAGVREEDVVATQSVWKYDTPDGRREYGRHWPGRCIQGVFADRAMELGVCRQRLQDYAVAWKRWIEDDNGVFAMLHGEVIVRVNPSMLSR